MESIDELFTTLLNTGNVRIERIVSHGHASPEGFWYPTTAKPVFIGHYWLSAHRPEVLAEHVACLDFSVAKGGFLCAYRWQGEQKLRNDHFAWLGDGRPKGGPLAAAGTAG
jgi:hypothetical protein